MDISKVLKKMTEELNENTDSQTGEDEVVTSEETTTDTQGELSDREKQFLARAKKAEGKLKDVKANFEEPKAEPIIKTNTEQTGPTIEDMVLVNRGYSIEEISAIKDGAKVLGIPVLEASNHDIIQAKINEGRQAAQVSANSMPASGGSAPAPRAKTVNNMTDDEHREWAESKMANAKNE